MVVRTRSCSGTIGLNLNRVKLHKGAPRRRRLGDPETLKVASARIAPGQLRARGFQRPPHPPAPSPAAAAEPTPEPALAFCFPFGTGRADEPHRSTRTYIQTLPDTAGSKRIKEIWNDMKKIS